MKVLVVGATGMLGYSIFRHLVGGKEHDVLGTVRSLVGKQDYFVGFDRNLVKDIDVNDFTVLKGIISTFKPDVVINCIGVIKQLKEAKNYEYCIELNALFPHKLANVCSTFGAKLIHFSTDCVFTGSKGLYKEDDLEDARDLYGRSKSIGEVDYDGHLTLRTSIIGHELVSSVSLISWFLNQKGSVNGYKNAVFSGLPTVEIANVLTQFVIGNKDLSGLYHLSVDPINKFDLLSIVNETYKKNLIINPVDEPAIDRSLDSSKFREKTRFAPKPWPELIDLMHKEYQSYFEKS